MTSGGPTGLRDESSMASLVLSGVQAIYKLTARKHKQLRQECEEIIQHIQREDEELQRAAQQQAAPSPTSASSATPAVPLLADSDADKYFLPFKLACESDNSAMQAVALNQIEKLIAYGYLDGASVADPAVYPPRKSEAADGAGGGSGGVSGRDGKVTSAPTDPTATKGVPSTAAPAPDQKSGAKEGRERGGGVESSRRLISVIVDTVYDCSLNKSRDVQLQAVKCILTALTSTTCSVHGQTLVTASYACWNIYLQASDDTIRNTARAALTQTFSLVFQRMESFGSQLKQLQQSAALHSAATAASSNNSATEARKKAANGSAVPVVAESNADAARQTAERSEKVLEERKDEEKEQPAQDEQKDSASAADTAAQPTTKDVEEKVDGDSSNGDAKPAASNDTAADNAPSSPIAATPATANPVESQTPPASAPASTPAAAAASPTSEAAPATSAASDSTAARPPPGKRGYCVVCAKPANFYCLQSRDSVCSVECKLVNLQRRDKKSTIASDVHAKIAKKFVILQTDAFMLLRALIRLSKKPLPSPAEQSAVDSKVLSLELLLAILKQPGATFKSSEQFVSLVRTDVTDVILKNSDASIEALFSLSSSLFVALVRHFRAHLHRIIGPVLDSIYLPYISSANSSYDVKYASLLVLKQICSEPSTIVELFLNYDCKQTHLTRTPHASSALPTVPMTR